MGRVKKPGLGHVLKQLCGVENNKSLAIGDWRKRPLPEEMMFYGVSDVTYLQYIAMTLVELAAQPVVTPAAAGDDGQEGTRAEQLSVSAAAEVVRGQGGAALAAPAQGPADGADGACESEQLEREGELRVQKGPGEDVGHDERTSRSSAVSACALAQALGDGRCTPSSLVEVEESLGERLSSVAAPDDVHQLLTRPGVLSRTKRHRQNSSECFDEAAETVYGGEHDASDCVASALSAACKTEADVATEGNDVLHTSCAMSHRTSVNEPGLQLQPSSTKTAHVSGDLGRDGELLAGSEEPAVGCIRSTPVQHHTSNCAAVAVPSAAAAPTDASGTAQGHSDTAGGASELDFDSAEGKQVPPTLAEPAGGAVEESATSSCAAEATAQQNEPSKKGQKKKGPVQAMDVARVWHRCCDRTLVVHRKGATGSSALCLVGQQANHVP